MASKYAMFHCSVAGLTLMAFCLLSAAAAAQTSLAPQGGSKIGTVGELTRVNAANILKQAQLTGAELDDKLAKLHNTGDATDVGGAYPAAISATPAASQNSATPVSDALPVVRGIFGANGQLLATLLYTDGSTMDVHAKGQAVPGGYVVAQFDAQHVALERRGHVYQLGFSSKAPMAAEQPLRSGGMTMPGVFPIAPQNP